MSKTFPVNGLKQLDDYLAALPLNLQKSAYRSGLVAAAAPVRDEARLRARKSSGQMAKGIKTGSPRQNEDGSFSVFIRLEGPHAFLGFFIEHGVLPHLIASTGKGQGRVAVRKAKAGDGEINAGVMKIGERFVSGIISHPGHAASPFMRPALDIRAEEAIKAFGVKVRAVIEKKTGFAAPMDEAA